jgi:hypothetical protein
MSDTVCIQERLPVGAAAVLINRNHSYTDIFMTVSAIEKRLFDAVDGRRTITKILQSTLTSTETSHLDMANAFFQLLWWHDQVVFDTTHN